MDKKVEDKMVQQIEKNLHNNIEENLFLSGRIYNKDKQPLKRSVVEGSGGLPAIKDSGDSNPVVSFDYYNSPINLSRAEYIRQARESCLRQLSEVQSTARAYDSYYLDTALQKAEQVNHKAPKTARLFQEGIIGEEIKEEETLREIAAFRYLVARTVCAIVIFLSIFLIDRFEVKIGDFTPDKIQEYVIGNDTLKELENLFVTWLKD